MKDLTQVTQVYSNIFFCSIVHPKVGLKQEDKM